MKQFVGLVKRRGKYEGDTLPEVYGPFQTPTLPQQTDPESGCLVFKGLSVQEQTPTSPQSRDSGEWVPGSLRMLKMGVCFFTAVYGLLSDTHFTATNRPRKWVSGIQGPSVQDQTPTLAAELGFRKVGV